MTLQAGDFIEVDGDAGEVWVAQVLALPTKDVMEVTWFYTITDIFGSTFGGLGGAKGVPAVDVRRVFYGLKRGEGGGIVPCKDSERLPVGALRRKVRVLQISPGQPPPAGEEGYDYWFDQAYLEKFHTFEDLVDHRIAAGRDARAQHIRRQRMTAHQTRARQGSSKAASSARASPAARRRARQKVPSSRAPQLSAMPSPSCSPLTPVVQLAAEGAAARGEVAPPPAVAPASAAGGVAPPSAVALAPAAGMAAAAPAERAAAESLPDFHAPARVMPVASRLALCQTLPSLAPASVLEVFYRGALSTELPSEHHSSHIHEPSLLPSSLSSPAAGVAPASKIHGFPPAVRRTPNSSAPLPSLPERTAGLTLQSTQTLAPAAAPAPLASGSTAGAAEQAGGTEPEPPSRARHTTTATNVPEDTERVHLRAALPVLTMAAVQEGLPVAAPPARTLTAPCAGGWTTEGGLPTIAAVQEDLPVTALQASTLTPPTAPCAAAAAAAEAMAAAEEGAQALALAKELAQPSVPFSDPPSWLSEQHALAVAQDVVRVWEAAKAQEAAKLQSAPGAEGVSGFREVAGMQEPGSPQGAVAMPQIARFLGMAASQGKAGAAVWEALKPQSDAVLPEEAAMAPEVASSGRVYGPAPAAQPWPSGAQAVAEVPQAMLACGALHPRSPSPKSAPPVSLSEHTPASTAMPWVLQLMDDIPVCAHAAQPPPATSTPLPPQVRTQSRTPALQEPTHAHAESPSGTAPCASAVSSFLPPPTRPSSLAALMGPIDEAACVCQQGVANPGTPALSELSPVPLQPATYKRPASEHQSMGCADDADDGVQQLLQQLFAFPGQQEQQEQQEEQQQLFASDALQQQEQQQQQQKEQQQLLSLESQQSQQQQLLALQDQREEQAHLPPFVPDLQHPLLPPPFPGLQQLMLPPPLPGVQQLLPTPTPVPDLWQQLSAIPPLPELWPSASMMQEDPDVYQLHVSSSFADADCIVKDHQQLPFLLPPPMPSQQKQQSSHLPGLPLQPGSNSDRLHGELQQMTDQQQAEHLPLPSLHQLQQQHQHEEEEQQQQQPGLVTPQPWLPLLQQTCKEEGTHFHHQQQQQQQQRRHNLRKRPQREQQQQQQAEQTKRRCKRPQSSEQQQQQQQQQHVLQDLKQLKVCEVFSGAGGSSGMEVQYQGCSLTPKWAVDNNASAASSYLLNHPNVQVWCLTLEAFLMLLRKVQALAQRILPLANEVAAAAAPPALAPAAPRTLQPQGAAAQAGQAQAPLPQASPPPQAPPPQAQAPEEAAQAAAKPLAVPPLQEAAQAELPQAPPQAAPQARLSQEAARSSSQAAAAAPQAAHTQGSGASTAPEGATPVQAQAHASAALGGGGDSSNGQEGFWEVKAIREMRIGPKLKHQRPQRPQTAKTEDYQLLFLLEWEDYEEFDGLNKVLKSGVLSWEPLEMLEETAGELLAEYLGHLQDTCALPLPEWNPNGIVVVGGPPCQGMSGQNQTALTQRILTCPRNAQIKVFMDFIAFIRPVFVVVENIPEVWQREGGVYVQFCMASLLNLRYQMRSGIIEAGGCGVPQARPRWILLAAAPGHQLPPFPAPSHQFGSRIGQKAVALSSYQTEVDLVDMHAAAKIREPWGLWPHQRLGDISEDLPAAVPAFQSILDCSYVSEPQRPLQLYLRGAPPSGSPSVEMRGHCARVLQAPWALAHACAILKVAALEHGLEVVGRVHCLNFEGNRLCLCSTLPKFAPTCVSQHHRVWLNVLRGLSPANQLKQAVSRRLTQSAWYTHLGEQIVRSARDVVSMYSALEPWSREMLGPFMQGQQQQPHRSPPQQLQQQQQRVHMQEDTGLQQQQQQQQQQVRFRTQESAEQQQNPQHQGHVPMQEDEQRQQQQVHLSMQDLAEQQQNLQHQGHMPMQEDEQQQQQQQQQQYMHVYIQEDAKHQQGHVPMQEDGQQRQQKQQQQQPDVQGDAKQRVAEPRALPPMVSNHYPCFVQGEVYARMQRVKAARGVNWKCLPGARQLLRRSSAAAQVKRERHTPPVKEELHTEQVKLSTRSCPPGVGQLLRKSRGSTRRQGAISAPKAKGRVKRAAGREGLVGGEGHSMRGAQDFGDGTESDCSSDGLGAGDQCNSEEDGASEGTVCLPSGALLLYEWYKDRTTKALMPLGCLCKSDFISTLLGRADPETMAQSHWSEPRTLSVRESMRVQGFPDYFTLASVGDDLLTLPTNRDVSGCNLTLQALDLDTMLQKAVQLVGDKIACLRNWEPQPQQLQELQGQQQQQQRQQQQQTGKHHAELRPRTPAVKREDPDPKHQQKQQHHRQQHNLKREEEGQHSQGKQQPSPMLQQQQQKQRQQSLAERALALDVQASELVGLPPGSTIVGLLHKRDPAVGLLMKACSEVRLRNKELFQMVGNAVAPPLASSIGRCLALAAQGAAPHGRPLVGWEALDPQWESIMLEMEGRKARGASALRCYQEELEAVTLD